LKVSLSGNAVPLLRYLANRDDVIDLLLPPPRLEDIFFGFYRPASDEDDATTGGMAADKPEPLEVARR
jgi:hypothetical protein